MQYTLVTTERGEVSWKGYSCSTWVHKKIIVGSFWVGSYDTTFETQAFVADEAECWKLAVERSCYGNAMEQDGTSFKFTDPPKGEGRWYSEVHHTIFNCAIQEITFLLPNTHGFTKRRTNRHYNSSRS